jgi:hypothetical protein
MRIAGKFIAGPFAASQGEYSTDIIFKLSVKTSPPANYTGFRNWNAIEAPKRILTGFAASTAFRLESRRAKYVRNPRGI